MNAKLLPLIDVIVAVYECGPLPSAIARKLGVSVERVKQAIAQSPEATATYKSMLEQWMRAIDVCEGDHVRVAKYMGVSARVCRAVLNENPILREHAEIKSAEIVSAALAQLRKAVERGERWAIELALLNSAVITRASTGVPSEVSLEDEAAMLGQDPATIKERLVHLLEISSEDV